MFVCSKKKEISRQIQGKWKVPPPHLHKHQVYFKHFLSLNFFRARDEKFSFGTSWTPSKGKILREIKRQLKGNTLNMLLTSINQNNQSLN